MHPVLRAFRKLAGRLRNDKSPTVYESAEYTLESHYSTGGTKALPRGRLPRNRFNDANSELDRLQLERHVLCERTPQHVEVPGLCVGIEGVESIQHVRLRMPRRKLQLIRRNKEVCLRSTARGFYLNEPFRAVQFEGRYVMPAPSPSRSATCRNGVRQILTPVCARGQRPHIPYSSLFRPCGQDARNRQLGLAVERAVVAREREGLRRIDDTGQAVPNDTCDNA